MHRGIPALSALLLLLAVPTAEAAEWSGAFPPAAVQTYLPAGSAKILVAGAGGDAADRDAATGAVVDALRASSSVKMVMTAESLGDVAGLDDAAVVAKAKALPVDHVFVVRVFPAQGGDYSVVVTMYAKDGAVAGAFTASSDQPLVANGGGSASPSGGMSSMAVAAVTAATSSAQGDMDARMKTYDERRIWLQGWAAVESGTGRIVSTWSVPQLGRYGDPLKPKEFYEVVGRDDLVAKYKSKQAVRAGIAGGSAAVMLGGLAYPLFLVEKPKGGRSAWECDTTFSTYSTSSTSSTTSSFKAVPKSLETDCTYNENHDIYEKQKTAWIVGGTLAGVGYVGLMVPLFISPNPASSNERLKMVDEYNAALRQELGIPDSVGTGPGPSGKPTPTASVFVSPTQVSLVVGF